MPQAHVRQGSEGYEVRPIDREEILRKCIEGEVEKEGRFFKYQPEPDAPSDSDVKTSHSVEFA